MLTDIEFFGQWDLKEKKWIIEGKIDYTYDKILEMVEEYAKQGSYNKAGEALLDYFRKRQGIKRPELSGVRNITEVNNWINRLILFNDKHIGEINLDNEPSWIRLDVTRQVKVLKGTFLLMGRDKEDSMGMFCAKESGNKKTAYLDIILKDGSKKVIYASADTYIRAGSFGNMNYGSEDSVNVRDSGHKTNSPADDDTLKGIIRFDLTSLTGLEDQILSASLYLLGWTDSQQGCKSILVLESYLQAWEEDSITWNSVAHCSFSYKGLKGGFDWVRPKGAHSEYINANTRFNWLNPMLVEYKVTGDINYAREAVSLLLDFIKDQGAGAPPKRDIEAGSRGIETPKGFFNLIDIQDDSVMNAEVCTELLKYVWEEAEFLYSGAYYRPDNNRGIWHTLGFYSLASYFPEFRKRNDWMRIINERLDYLLRVLVRPDGAYIENTFGYPGGVISFFTRIKTIAENCGEKLPELVDRSIEKLAVYLMNMSYPNGFPPKWGEGNPRDYRQLLYDIGVKYNNQNLIYWGSGGVEGKVPDYTSVHYPVSKLAVMRNGWDRDASVTFITARNGGNHCHRDSLHFTIYAGGRELLTDTGMSSYDRRHPHFVWQRERTLSHNTIEINDTPQRGDHSNASLNGENSTDMTITGQYDIFTGWTDATEGFRHCRKITYLKTLNMWLISDRVVPEKPGLNKYNQTWHLKPDAEPSLDPVTKVFSSNYKDGVNVKIVPVLPEKVQATLENGYDSDPQVNTKYASYVQTAEGEVTFETIIAVEKLT